MFELPDADDAAVGMAEAVDQVRLEPPRYGSRLELSHYILTFHEQSDRAAAQVGLSIAAKPDRGGASARARHIDADVQVFGPRVMHHGRQRQRGDHRVQEAA